MILLRYPCFVKILNYMLLKTDCMSTELCKNTNTWIENFAFDYTVENISQIKLFYFH